MRLDLIILSKNNVIYLFLRRFDYLQSDNVDILARAMELSSIPSDSNNNDLLSHAMKLSEINGEIDMNF